MLEVRGMNRLRTIRLKLELSKLGKKRLELDLGRLGKVWLEQGRVRINRLELRGLRKISLEL